MILALLEIFPQPGRRKEVIDILLSGKEQILFKSGCLGCELMAGIQDDKLIYIEKWESNKEFSKHLASDDYFRILSALEFASKPPAISFYEVRDEKGMEVIEEIRNGLETEEE
jgi:quinol monooxygenase YgiN